MLVKESGVEPLIQMVVRDRNRIALQSDLLGASALGVRNLLCLSGDHQKFGDDPQAKNVFDIDSMQLINLAKTMRDEGVFPSGDKLEGAPKFYIGCAVNPFAAMMNLPGHRTGVLILYRPSVYIIWIPSKDIWRMPRKKVYTKK